MCYRGEEKHGEKREERQREIDRERSMGRGETRGSDGENMMRREKKWESLPWERVGVKIFLFPETTEVKEKDNIYRRCDAWERDYFPIFFFFGKQPIENKSYFY